LLLAAVALGRAAWLRERGAWLIVALVLHQVWLDSGMKDITPFSVLGTRTWSGGVSFGPRKLVDVLPLLLPAMLSWTAAAHRGGRQRMLGAVALAASVPTLLLHVAAFVQPDQTTGALHDWGSLIATTGLAFDTPALQAAVQQRALPWSVPIVVVACVTLPLLLAVGRTALALRRASGQHCMLLLSAALLVLGFVAHGWTSVLQVRSDALLAEDPQRMQRAAAELHSRHRAVVDRIEAHHATLRSVLGDGAAP
jgi:hypothetical protein